jgi:short-subunit dehydrogenase/acyl carrier protein
LTGKELSPEEATSPAYWASHIRQPVRFAEGVAHLKENGASRFLELGPDATLTAIAQECELAEEAVLAATMRREQPEANTLLTSLGAMHAGGAEVDFSPLLRDSAPSLTELPTYPFQRQRYWFEGSGATGDAASLGQARIDHPMLGARISLAREGEHLFTGRISSKDHPWIRDHAISGTAILPATALVEVALRAGRELGAERLEELILEAPLPLPEAGAVQLQLAVAPDDEDPERLLFSVHSRPQGDEDEDGERPWARHAGGTLTPGDGSLAFDFDAVSWPPPGAEALDIADLYGVAADLGLEYGPAFQGLESAWRRGEEVFAEVSLAPEQAQEAERFEVHPALLDAAGHTSLLEADPAGEAHLPFVFGDVRLGEVRGASQLRLRVRKEGERSSLSAADAEGRPVCQIGSVSLRQVDVAALAGPEGKPDALYHVGWERVELPEAAATEMELFECVPDDGPDRALAAHDLCAQVLERLQAFLAEDSQGRLAFVTENAVGLDGQEAPDPAAAAVGGLVRSAQSEHPGRFVLVDLDGSEASRSALAAALAIEAEGQIALREGTAHVPRLAAVDPTDGQSPAEIDPEGTVLVTGGLTGLGALAARHLAAAHGARRLLLASRRGGEAPAAAELLAELAELGCEATAVACDVADRQQLEDLLSGIPAKHPLVAIVHCAGSIDDGTIASLDAERLDGVLRPKADAAWHLHELTRDMPLSDFVLYSSAVGVFGNPGQGNYAAANCFLDALAQLRRAKGLPAKSIAWGLWEEKSEITAEVTDADRSRLGRNGLRALTAEEGLELLDRVRAQADPSAIAAALDTAGLRSLARADLLPPLFAKLVPSVRRRQSAGVGSLARRLEGVPEADREAAVLDVVLDNVAAVLGHPSGASIEPRASFQELGFDSLGAVQLRNRLAQVTGMRLEATLVFDRPTPQEVAGYLLKQLDPKASARSPIDLEFDRLEAALAGIGGDDRDTVVARLRLLGIRWRELPGTADNGAEEADFEVASDDELFELIDRELGVADGD